MIAMANDETLLSAFRRAGRKRLTIETLGILSGMESRDVCEKIKRMEKFGFVKSAGRKKVMLWEILDE